MPRKSSKRSGTKPKGKRNLESAKRRAFLTAYTELGNITAAARAAGVARQKHYEWLESDPEYAKKFADAHEQAVELLEAEARERAVNGIQEPVIYQGELTFLPKFNRNGEMVMKNGKPVLSDIPLTIRKPSDTLLIFLLKGAKPDKYRDNAKIEHSGPGGAPIPVALKTSLANLTDEQLDSLRDLARAAAAPPSDRGGDSSQAAQ